MKTIRCRCLLFTVVCFTCTSAAAQFADDESPPPTRWTAEATTIDATDQDPETTVPVRPSFPVLSHQTDDAHQTFAGQPAAAKISGPAVTVGSSLAVVLGLFAGLVWLTRRFGSRGLHQGAIPNEVFRSLGSSPIDPRTRVTMLRCGNRILVVAQSASGVQPLAEIDDPEEVRQLTASCLGDAGRSFNSTLKAIEQEPVPHGFTGTVESRPISRKRSRLFATA